LLKFELFGKEPNLTNTISLLGIIARILLPAPKAKIVSAGALGNN
jgi:hypothetical protein